jgi:hypothetical protein
MTPPKGPKRSHATRYTKELQVTINSQQLHLEGVQAKHVVRGPNKIQAMTIDEAKKPEVWPVGAVEHVKNEDVERFELFTSKAMIKLQIFSQRLCRSHYSRIASSCLG